MKSVKRFAGKFTSYTFLTIAAVISIFPLYWMINAATHTNAEVLAGNLLPGSNLIENIKTLFAGQQVGLAMWNSFRNAAVVTILSLLVCSIAGYGFEVYHSKAKDRVMSILLLAMMVPFVATIVPLFKLFANFKLINTTLAVIAPVISTPFLIMLFRQSTRSFPHEIIEAARIDGFSELAIFFRIFIPTMKSTYAAAMTITFMNAWNNYLWPRIVLTKRESITMPMLIALQTESYTTNYATTMLLVLICTLPTVLIFFVLQRSFATGITGAVKS